MNLQSVYSISAALIGAKRISDQLDYTITYDFNGNRVKNSVQSSQLPYLSIGDYVACMYEGYSICFES